MAHQSTLPSPINAVIKLSDGRQLAYSEAGPATGSAVLYLHGNPGSRKEVLRPAYLKAFDLASLRVITIDRPGYGDSDPPAEKGHLAFVKDVRELMNKIGLQQAIVVGHSRGTLPAISLGVLLEHQIGAVGVFGATGLPDDPELMASQAPETRVMLHLVKSLPAVARTLIRLNHRLDRLFPKSAASRMARLMSSAADREQLKSSGQDFVATLAAGMQRDPAFAIDDWRSWLIDPLGFEPAKLRLPLLLWTGAEDGLCPAGPVHHMVQRIPGTQLRKLPGVGHLHTPEILVSLMQATIKASIAAGKTA